MLLKELMPDIFSGEYGNLDITGVTSKMDEIESGVAFVFLDGVFQSHRHLIYEIKNRRPSIIISEMDIENGLPHIKVKNARKVLSEMLYRFYFSRLTPPPIVGITGTNGKSSILNILYHVFRDKYKIGLFGTQRIEIDGIPMQNAEYTMTTPDPEVLYKSLYHMKMSGCDLVFMEVSSHALALEKVAPLTFEIALFSGLSEEHLDFHKTKEEYVRAKEKIFSQSRFAVLNTDDETGQEYSKRISTPYVTLGCRSGDVRILNPLSNFLKNTVFTYSHQNNKFFVKTPLLAPHNAYNCAFALYVYEKIDGNLAHAVARLASLPHIKGRMECVLHAPSVFLDYAHTPQAMKNVISYFYTHKSNDQKLVVLFGAGGDREREKRAEMACIAENYADFCVVTTDNPRFESQSQIFHDIKKGFQKRNHRFITNRQNAVAYAFSLCQSKDILLLLGKGHEPYIIKKKEKIPYSELYSLFLARIRGGIYES